ncbi:MAG: MFS transporter [Tractidigestivibacter sp.]|jgi:DHA1 family inner membrane transport protein|uniref:MFS transporter n=1 Tax=Tractidigestivibacter sp. TaxID=2847320 RepID=UPI003D93BEBA
MSSTSISAGKARLCVALLVLLGFSLGCSEFVVIGIESELAADFNVSLSTAGQLISSFSLAYAVLTPLLTLSTGRFRRFQLLVAYAAIFCIGNIVSALAQNFEVLLAARIVLGSVSGALLAVGVTFIPELVDAKRSSIVLSIVYAAFSVAMIIVTSVGKILADTLDWHYAMYGTLVMAVATCAALIALMPRTGATDEPATFGEQARLLAEPCVISGILIFVFGVGSIYTLYGYITPYLQDILGMDTMQASATLMAYGAVTFFSNLLGGWIDSRFGIRALVVTFILQAATLMGIYLVGPAMPEAIILIFVMALLMYSFSISCISLFMAVARRRHPKALTLASSLEPMSFNVGISFGTAVGGTVVSSAGLAQLGAVGAILALVASALSAITYALGRRTPLNS